MWKIRCKKTGNVFNQTGQYIAPEGFTVYSFISNNGKSFDSALYNGFFDKYETVNMGISC